MDTDRLRKIELFAEIPDDVLEQYAQMADETTIEEGEELARAGTWPYQLFAIEEGEVEIRRNGDTVATLGAGDVVGETGVVKRGLRNADVVATSPVKAIFFTQDQVKRMRKDLPDLDDRLHALLEERT
jgi:CRP/FNR family transcriptional regulator, cyclic AMP receptor protein